MLVARRVKPEHLPLPLQSSMHSSRVPSCSSQSFTGSPAATVHATPWYCLKPAATGSDVRGCGGGGVVRAPKDGWTYGVGGGVKPPLFRKPGVSGDLGFGSMGPSLRM